MESLYTRPTILILLLSLIACSPVGSPGIKEIEFGRGAIAVELDRKVLVKEIDIYQGQRRMASEEVGRDIKRAILDLDWQGGKTYRIEICLRSGSHSLISTCKAPERPSPIVLRGLDLESVDPHELWDYCYIGGVVAFSPDGNYLAVGTEKGYLRLIDVKTGRVLWSKRIGEGRIITMAFSPDGRYLAMGEQSRDAFLYLYDTKGQLLWRFKASSDIGTIGAGENKYHLPVVNSLIFDPDIIRARVYLVARHYLGPVDRGYSFKGKVYCLDLKTGKTIWSWPQGGCMDAAPDALRIDRQGRYLLFSDYWKGSSYNRSLYCLETSDGHLLWSWDFRPLFPEKRLGIWHGVDISPDGRYVAAFSSDGRGFLLDNRELIETGGKRGVVWERPISTPILVNGLTIYAFPALAKVAKGYVAFLTGNTKARQGKRRPAIEYPNANSLFVYDLKGNLQWTAEVGGASYTDRVHSSADGRYIILPVRYNRVRASSLVQGLYLFDNSRSGPASERLVWSFHTDGMCLSADISQDGRYIAALEYPLDIDIRREFQDIKGRHRLYILR